MLKSIKNRPQKPLLYLFSYKYKVCQILYKSVALFPSSYLDKYHIIIILDVKPNTDKINITQDSEHSLLRNDVTKLVKNQINRQRHIGAY